MLESLDHVNWASFEDAVVHGQSVATRLRELADDPTERTGELLCDALFGEDPRITALAEAVLPFVTEIIATPGEHHRIGALGLFCDYERARPEYVDEFELDRRLTARDINVAFFRWQRVQERLRHVLPALIDAVSGGLLVWQHERELALAVLAQLEPAMAVAPTLRRHASLRQSAKRMAAGLTSRERILWIAEIAGIAVTEGRSHPESEASRDAVQSLISPAGGAALSELWMQELFLRLGARERELVSEWL